MRSKTKCELFFRKTKWKSLTAFAKFFYIPRAPASRNSAAMLEAGGTLEENVHVRGKIDKKRQTAGSPLKTFPKQCASIAKKGENLNET